MKKEEEWLKEMVIKMRVISGSIRQRKFGVKLLRLYPGGYLDIENWLKTTGRGNVDVYL